MPIFGQKPFTGESVSLSDYLSAVKNNPDLLGSASSGKMSDLRTDASFLQAAQPFVDYMYEDEESVDVIEKLRNEDWNMYHLAKVASGLSDAPEEVRESYKKTRERFESTDVESFSEYLKAAKNIGFDIATDPVTLLFLATVPTAGTAGAAALAARSAAKQAGKQALKQAGKKAVKKPAKKYGEKLWEEKQKLNKPETSSDILWKADPKAGIKYGSREGRYSPIPKSSKAVKETAEETVEKGGYEKLIAESAVGVLEGGAFGALDSYYTQSRDIAAKIQEASEVDKSAMLLSAGEGALTGGALGAAFSGQATRGIKNIFVNEEELKHLNKASSPSTLNDLDSNIHTGNLDESTEELVGGVLDSFGSPLEKFSRETAEDLTDAGVYVRDSSSPLQVFMQNTSEGVRKRVNTFAQNKGISSDGVEELEDNIEAELSKPTTSRKGILGAVSKVIDYTSSRPAYFLGRVNSFLDPYTKESKTIKELQKKFRYDSNRTWTGKREAEEADYSETYSSIFGDYHIRMKYAIDPILRSTHGARKDEALAELVNVVRGKRTDDDMIRAAARSIRKDLKEAGKRLEANGLLDTSKEIKNYFPRVWDRRAIEKNPEDFKNILIKAGEAKDDSEAQSILRNMLEIENQVPGAAGSGSSFLANRQFTKIKDDSVFNKFLDTNPQNVLNTYYSQIGRQLARKTVFGASDWTSFKKLYRDQIYDELGDKRGLKAMKDLKTVWMQQTGEGASQSNVVVDGISTLQRFSLLPLATLSSISEVFLNMNRGGVFNTIKNFGKASKTAYDMVTYNVVNSLKDDHNLSTPEAFRHMQKFGIALDLAATDQVDRLAGEAIGTKWMARSNQLFFRYGTLLEPWTKLVQLTSFNVGRDLIADNLKAIQKRRSLGKPVSSRIQRKMDELTELDVDVDEGLKWLERTNADMTTEDAFNAVVDKGAARYTNEIVLNTSREAGLKSYALTANPYTGLLFQLSAYPAAFTNTVLKDMVRRVSRSSLKGDIGGATKIVGAALTLQGVANFTNYARNGVLTQNPNYEEKSFWDHQQDALARWGGQGVAADIATRAKATDQYYGSTIAAMAAFGPTVSDLAITIRTDDYPRILTKFVPYYNAMPKETRKNIKSWISDLFKEEKRYTFKGGGVVDIDGAAEEPDERIDKMTGVPYDQQAGGAFVDVEDPFRRSGLDEEINRLGFREGSKADDPSMYRSDGSKKSDKGFLGPIEAEDGRTMTEFSIGVKINGQETEIPSLVPGLTEDEISSLKESKVPKSVAVKARNHALKRLSENKSVFYQDGED